MARMVESQRCAIVAARHDAATRGGPTPIQPRRAPINKNAAATSPEMVRTWFHAVHRPMYVAQNRPASPLVALTAASLLFNGTLNRIVTRMVPIRYDRLPASRYSLVTLRQLVTASTATAMHAAAVPNNAVTNTGVIATTLIDCMAA